MIPCYITGKGMFATNTTWSFKTSIIAMLELSGIGYDTRHHYYRQQFPALNTEQVAKLICEPMENYDKDWPAFIKQEPQEHSIEQTATAFMLRLDTQFRAQAQRVIACYDEAGFGSGVNAMVFLQAGKPILGFYNHHALAKTVNLSNILQLEMTYPELFTLHEYQHPEEIPDIAQRWLEK